MRREPPLPPSSKERRVVAHCSMRKLRGVDGQNLQGRRAAGWAQLDAVEDAQNSSHQPEQDESEPDAEQDSVQGVRRLMKEEHRAVVAGRHRRGCEALDQTDKWRV
ncbi:hypothetical protein DHEL01_v209047 [Diaporthe helianthi]|uniref:Uncharacterized protein n=1 Tax=Diaporthe helianthi TaxID=158607 RepID=A0A2P5HQQ1_DIAHE|nr:hypothetical protein DHEL01_v209047 [Diaporthe helianthi]